MARKTTRSKRRAGKRPAVNEELMQRRRALEQTVRLERKVRNLALEALRAHARAKSKLWTLARTVLNEDAEFRVALLDEHNAQREPALAGSSASE